MGITELSEKIYSECYIKSIKLSFGSIAMHTYNYTYDIEIIDLKIIKLSPYFLYGNFSRVFNKLMTRIFK